MKKRFFRTELKRNLHFLPVSVISTVVLVTLIIILALLYYRNGPMTQSQKKYVIGVVGNADEKYLDFGITTMEKIDSTGDMFTYRNLGSEKEAARLRARGKLDAYIVVPDGWMDSVVTGDNDRPIKVVAADGQKGMTSILIDRVLDTASTLFTDSQSAVFSVQDVLKRQGYSDVDSLRDRYNIEVFLLAKNRDDLSNINLLGEINSLTLTQSVGVGAVLFALLLMGLTNTPLFIRRNDSLLRMVSARGCGPLYQTIISYAAYLIHYFICLTAVFAVVSVPALIVSGINVFAYYPVVLPVAVLFSAFQYFMFEITNGVVNTMLLQFTATAVMSYVSGYFYMQNFFPPVIQAIGKVLPTGIAFSSTASFVSDGAGNPWYIALTLLYAAAFIMLSFIFRKRKIPGREYEND